MKAQDFTAKDNDRADAIAKLQEYCHANGLDYSYNTDDFIVRLPQVDALPLATETGKKRRRFDISKWGSKGVDESNLPDELPPAEYTLDEGETPEGDDEK